MDWIQTIPTAIVLAIIPIITNMAWKIYQWVSAEERVKRSLALREALGKSGFKSEKAFKSIDGKIERDLERYCNFDVHIEVKIFAAFFSLLGLAFIILGVVFLSYALNSNNLDTWGRIGSIICLLIAAVGIIVSFHFSALLEKSLDGKAETSNK